MLACGHVFQAIAPSEYVKDLVESIKVIYDDVQRHQQAIAARGEDEQPGRASAQIEVGDYVLVKREKQRRSRGDGSPKAVPVSNLQRGFQVRTKIGPETFAVCDPLDPKRPMNFTNKLNADRLIRIDMPELELKEGQHVRLDVHDSTTDEWRTATIEKYAYDGRVALLYEHDPSELVWLDPSRERYRWVV